jgi:alcohol dehydrogenase, propanol-preferring
MRAMVLRKSGPISGRPLEMAELPVPTPGDHEVLIKVAACGVCHTDLDIVEGRLQPSRLPRVPGHQVVGYVEKMGKSADRFAIGQRVGVMWLFSSCGECAFCRAGRENLCGGARWTGLDADGGYAEYIVADARFATAIPELFSDAQAAPLLCAGVIGYRALRLCDVQDGQALALYGFGASAHFVVQVARYKWPRNKVYAFTRGEHHKRLALELGADWAGSPGEAAPGPFQKAIDFTPTGQTVKDALGQVERGGRVVVNAIRKESPVPEMDYARYLWNEKELVSTANVTRTDATEFLEVAAGIPIVAKVEEFALEDANEALHRVKDGSLKAAGVLVMR